jgi:glutamyl-tRNA synthetase/nondiscriminating glutamyl-tRNA synthetase
LNFGIILFGGFMVKVRFAPSPTGYLHIGGARTALINYLYAQKTGGKFVLRIEDTDENRSTKEMTVAILEGLDWLKIKWDEGPLFQSERKKIHQDFAFQLLERGFAYRCFCSKEEIEERKKRLENPAEWKYDKKCRAISKEESDKRAKTEEFALRCRIPEGKIEWDDFVKGKISFDSSEIEDFVILRSDGSPTYNLSVVADDSSLRITHILRGEDHISNTPKQLAIYKGLGIEPPLFGHLPLILGKDRKKLSKRHGTTSVTAFKKEGILSLALFNFLASLGTNLEEEKCISREEIVKRFEIEKIKNSASVFDYDKLLFLNGKLISEMDLKELKSEFKDFWEFQEFPEDKALDVMRTRSKTLLELAKDLIPFVKEDFKYDEAAVSKIDREKISEHFGEFIARLEKISEWKKDNIEEALRGFAAERGLKAKDLIHPSRLFLVGKGESPSIFDVFYAMGKEKSLSRLKRGFDFIKNGGKNV